MTPDLEDNRSRVPLPCGLEPRTDTFHVYQVATLKTQGAKNTPGAMHGARRAGPNSGAANTLV